MRDYSDIIRAVAPKADGQFVASFAKVAGRQFAGRSWLNDTALAGVLAHMAHETMGFTKFVENMNYSAQRICEVWPSRFPTVASAQPYARNPEKLANRVYANRMGNGPPESGDGWRYRGGGGLQHTGKSEYERVNRSTGYNQDEVRNPARADAILAAALSYCEARNVTSALMSGDMDRSTVLINGGKIGLADRKVMYRRARAALSGNPATAKVERTTVERRDEAKRNATVAAGSSVTSAGAGTATQTVQAPKQPEPEKPVSGAPIGLWLALAILSAVGFAALAIWFWRHAQRLGTVIIKDQAETSEARANDP